MATNCPQRPDYDPGMPIRHENPVHHPVLNIPLSEWQPRCVWDQLQHERVTSERDQANYHGETFLYNLEVDWARRDLCSGCLRQTDHPFQVDVDHLRKVAQFSQGKLHRIRGAVRQLEGQELRRVLVEILDAPEPGH